MQEGMVKGMYKDFLDLFEKQTGAVQVAQESQEEPRARMGG
jgi:hypothetical protein